MESTFIRGEKPQFFRVTRLRLSVSVLSSPKKVSSQELTMVSRRIVLLLILALIVPGCVTLAGAQAGASQSAASGTFTVNGKTVQLKYVYALIKPDLFHEEKDALYVVLSDAPIEESKLRSPMGLFDSAKAGALHAIEVKFDEEAQPSDGQLYNNNFKDASNVSVSGMHKFVPRHFEAGKLIAGKLYVEPQSSFGDEDKWVYSVTFSASIMPKPVEKLAALDSPPALAVHAFLRAIAGKNKEAIKKTIMPNMAADLDGPQGAQMMAMLPAMFDPKMKITKVVMHGDDKAEVTLQQKEKGLSEKTTITTAKLNGAWRVSKE
jgi:hypothetical protein